MTLTYQELKISEDNILSDIMSDLDGSTASTVVKTKPAPSKVTVIESSKKEAQNYFKSLSSSIKKPAKSKTEEPKIITKEDSNVRNGCFKHYFLVQIILLS